MALKGIYGIYQVKMCWSGQLRKEEGMVSNDWVYSRDMALFNLLHDTSHKA